MSKKVERRGSSQRQEQGVDAMGDTEQNAVETVTEPITTDDLVRAYMAAVAKAKTARKAADEAVARAEESEREAFEAKEAVRKVAPELFS